eukprot:65361-Chlamydomonas_euryale.AAC.1
MRLRRRCRRQSSTRAACSSRSAGLPCACLGCRALQERCCSGSLLLALVAVPCRRVAALAVCCLLCSGHAVTAGRGGAGKQCPHSLHITTISLHHRCFHVAGKPSAGQDRAMQPSPNSYRSCRPFGHSLQRRADIAVHRAAVWACYFV